MSATLYMIAPFRKDKAGATGLTVAFTAKRLERSTGISSDVVTADAAVEWFGGLYVYPLTNADTRAYVYGGVFTASDSSLVDDNDVAAAWVDFSPAAELALPDAIPNATPGGLPTITIDNTLTPSVSVAGTVTVGDGTITGASFAAGALAGQTVNAILPSDSTTGTTLANAVTSGLNTQGLTSSVVGEIATDAGSAATNALTAASQATTAANNTGTILATLTAIKGSGWVTGDNLHGINQAIADGAGGGLTTEQAEQLAQAAAGANRISTGGNTFRGPMQSGTIIIGQGSALTDTSTTPITIPQDGGNWPNLASGTYTATLTLTPTARTLRADTNAASLSVVGTYTGTVPSQVLTFRPGAATATLTPDSGGGPAYHAQVWAQQGTNAATAVMLYSGAGSVVDDIRS